MKIGDTIQNDDVTFQIVGRRDGEHGVVWELEDGDGDRYEVQDHDIGMTENGPVIAGELFPV